MRLTPLVTVTLALCSLAACASSGSGASAPAPAVVTPSAQVSASAPPPVPAPSTPATAEGAIAFVRAYYAEMNHALYQNDATALGSYLSPTCPCRKFFAELEDHRTKSQHWTEHVQSIDSVRVQVFSPGHADLLAITHWPETNLVDAQGHVFDHDPGHRATERIVLDRQRGVWSISAIYGSYKAAA